MLKEELRLFPGNQEGFSLFQRISPIARQDISTSKDEFSELYQKVRKFTMVGEERMRALYLGAINICEADLRGNFVECGVAAGGSSALLAWVIQKYSHHPCFLYCFDTFSGMPKPTALDAHAGIDAQKTGWGQGTCAAPVGSLMEVASLLDVASLVKPIPGLFQDTLPLAKAEIGPIALLHLDGDWYESTRAILENLYPQVVPGAYLQVDDYGHWEGCRKAFHDYFEKQPKQPDLEKIDATWVWFNKSGP